MNDLQPARVQQRGELSASMLAVPAGASLGPEGLANLFRRHRWLIGVCATVVTAIVLGYTLLQPRLYEAVTSIRVDDRRMNLPGMEQVVVGSEINTEMEMLRSRSLAADVVQRLALQLVVIEPLGVTRRSLLDSITVSADADSARLSLIRAPANHWILQREGKIAVLATARAGERLSTGGVSFVPSQAAAAYPRIRIGILPLNDAVENLRASVKISRVGNDANILLVQSRGADPVLQRDLVNALASGFIDRRQSAERTEARTRVGFLREQLDTLKRQLEVSEETLRKFREHAQIADLKTEASSQVSRQAQMQADRSVLDAERSALAALLADVQSSAATAAHGREGESPYRRLLAFPTLFRNPAASELLRSLDALQNERRELLTRRTTEDPDVLILDRRIAQVDEQLRSIATTYLQGLTAQIASLDAAQRQFDVALDAIPFKELRLAQLERMPKVLDQMYELVQSRLKEAEIAQAAIDPTVRIVDPAVLPDRPVGPRRVVNVGLGVVLGVTLGFGLALFREWRDRTVHTRADVMRITGTPVIGLIPRIPRVQRVKRSRARALPSGRVYTFFQLGAQAERLIVPSLEGGPLEQAYHRLDTHLAFVRPGDPLRVILCTSPLSGDGKTTTAVNFAIASARQGTRVVLVDTDLRRGAVHRIFGIARAPGLSDILSGVVTLEAALRAGSVGDGPDLMAISAGAAVERPEALLSSERMGALIARLRNEYELVILDTAPVNVVTDATLLARHVDGVLVVARASLTAHGALSYAMEQLRAVHAPVVGAVLNDIDLQRDIYYDPTYRYQGYDDPYYSKANT